MSKVSILFLCLLCLTGLSACAAGPSARLGFIDHKGNIAVDLEPYQGSTFHQPVMTAFQVEDFSDGMAYVTFWNKRKGFFDSRGKLLETTGYYGVGEFHEGRARCTPVEGGKAGFIDKTGKFSIQPTYNFAQDFSEGLAGCLTDQGWVFIDKAGKQAIGDRYQFSSRFSDGLANVKKANQWGWIDRKGRFMPHSEFEQVYPTSCGITAALSRKLDRSFSGQDSCKVSYFDERGQLLFVKTVSLSLKNLFINESDTTRRSEGRLVRSVSDSFDPGFHEDLAAVQVGTKFGYMNKSGAIVIPAKYNCVFPFRDGMAMVYNDNAGGTFGYIDRSGREIVPPTFYIGARPSEGFAAVYETNRSGCRFINKSGKFVFSSSFYCARPFREGLAGIGHCYAGSL